MNCNISDSHLAEKMYPISRSSRGMVFMTILNISLYCRVFSNTRCTNRLYFLKLDDTWAYFFDNHDNYCNHAQLLVEEKEVRSDLARHSRILNITKWSEKYLESRLKTTRSKHYFFRDGFPPFIL